MNAASAPYAEARDVIRMAPENTGVRADSVHVSANPSAMAQESLLYVETAGTYHVSEQYRISRLCFGNYLLILVQEGRLFCSADGSTATAGPGDAMLLESRKPHTYYAARPTTFSFVHFGGREADRLFPLIREKAGLLIKGDRSDALQELLLQLIAQLRTDSLDEFEASARLYRLLMLLYADAQRSRLGQSEQELVRRIQDYILTHLAERLTVEQLAAQAGYSPTYFSQLFRQATGYAPYAFILKARLEHAQHLLIRTALSIREVAEQSGFPSQANFSYMFRKEFGCTPTAYRDMLLK